MSAYLKILLQSLSLTYPVWGVVVTFAIAGLLPRNAPEIENVMQIGAILTAVSAWPIWYSDKSGLSKVLLTFGYYLFAYVAMFFITFGFARCHFLQSCAMG